MQKSGQVVVQKFQRPFYILRILLLDGIEILPVVVELDGEQNADRLLVESFKHRLHP
jgi:hypothetical protein